MGFYYEIESWKDIPMHKTFTLVQTSSYIAAIKEFEQKEKKEAPFIVKEFGHARYWIPARLDEWDPNELTAFQESMKDVTE